MNCDISSTVYLGLFFQLLLHVGNASSTNKTVTHIKIATIVSDNDNYLFSISHVRPSIEYAIEQVHNLNILPNWIKLDVNYSDSHCNAKDAPVAAFSYYMQRSVDMYLGPVCDYSLAPIARYAPFWNLPVISPGGFAHDFGFPKTDSTLSEGFLTLTRVGMTFNSMAWSILNTIKYFGWNKMKLIYNGDGHSEVSPRFCYLAGSALIYYIKAFSAYETLEHDFFLYTDSTDSERMLKDKVGIDYSVVVLCASADSVREIMIKAHELNFDNGEYVFFNIDLFSSKNESKKPWYRENDTKERNDNARKAYEALMTVTLRKPTSPEYKNFSSEVKRRAKIRYENFTYGEEEVNSFVGAFHDAVILYALALNETLEANRSITNGTEITRRMWNRTFRGITGNVSIDDNGDRNADYSLLDMDPETGEFEVVANYFGNTKRYEPVAGKHIRWAGNYEHAPPDTPKCGFDNSKCPPDEPFPEYGIVIIVLGSLLLLVVVAAFFIYRHIKLEAELAEMNWRVKWEDIMLGTIEGERKMKKQAASNLSLARTEDSSFEGNLLIERTRPTVNSSCCTWCKCGQCDVTERERRVCCRHIEKLEDRLEDRLQAERCITSTKDFQDVVLNPQVLLTVYIHVMLAKKQRGNAPYQLTPYKCRLMATRQFLCWLHSGEVLQRQTKWAIPACVIRAIKLMFPEVGAEMTSGDDACSLTLEDILPLENHSSV